MSSSTGMELSGSETGSEVGLETASEEWREGSEGSEGENSEEETAAFPQEVRRKDTARKRM